MTEYSTNPTLVNTNKEAVRRFLQGENGVKTTAGRLLSYEAEDGRILLLSYANEVLAEVTNDADDVTLFTGHYGQVSQATTKHIATLGSVLSNTEGKNVTVIDTAPTMGVGARASESAQYISNYIGDFSKARDFSPVELDARETVEQALQERLAQLF